MRVAFALDCCDREAMSFLATTGGISGEDVRDLMVTAVEHRFGQDQSPASHHPMALRHGSCYIAGDTRSFARDIGLEPRTTPIESPQSNGMAEAFVRTIKRDYVRVSPRPDAVTVMHQWSAWFAHTTHDTKLTAELMIRYIAKQLHTVLYYQWPLVAPCFEATTLKVPD